MQQGPGQALGSSALALQAQAAGRLPCRGTGLQARPKSVSHGTQRRGRDAYLVAMSAQLGLLGRDVVPDVGLELLPPQLDAAGQGVQLLFSEAWDLGQARVGVKKHGLRWNVSLLIGRMIPLWARAGAGLCGLQVVIYGGKRYLAAPEQRQSSHSWRAVICSTGCDGRIARRVPGIGE